MVTDILKYLYSWITHFIMIRFGRHHIQTTNNFYQMPLGLKVLARHFRYVYEVNYILMTFYPT